MESDNHHEMPCYHHQRSLEALRSIRAQVRRQATHPPRAGDLLAGQFGPCVY